MIPSERRDFIYRYLHEYQTVSISSLVELMNVSHMTVRRDISALEEEGKVQGANRPLPIIHCKAGVGRTGVLIAAMQLVRRGNKHSAQKIVLGLRESGNPTMIQNESQYNTLLALNKMLRDKKSPSKGGE